MRTNDRQYVKKQYQTTAVLKSRIGLHERYSVNRQPFGDWIFAQFEWKDGLRVLEVGCGTGALWAAHRQQLPQGMALLLTDFSAAMLEETRAALGEDTRFTFAQADVQALPFEAGAFDAVIANMMLYHVPDLSRAVGEIHRVLKPGGTLYAATTGDGGIHGYLGDTLVHIDPALIVPGLPFTLQNGVAPLLRCFQEVTVRRREDALHITRVEDFADYIASLTALEGIPFPHDAVCDYYRTRMEGGVLKVPKEYGMLIARKAH